ncbi:MAG: fasciclin domain-containing protein, partial [Anaerolineales bacterium]|nr:fasciclin domain-containing protein [Anaerolineales bacterium]
MKRSSILLSVVMIAAFALAACGAPATPAPTEVPPTAAPTATPEPELSDIVDTAVADGRFTTLVAAVQAAELVNTLKGEGPFTVFAPTDDAFAALPEGTLDSLLLPENKQALTDILLYHVVSGKVMAADVTSLTSATTVLGKDVTVKADMGNVYLNDTVKIILTDIETSNGVIHVIDAVLLPPTEDAASNTIVDIAVSDGRFATLVAAVTAADLVE